MKIKLLYLLLTLFCFENISPLTVNANQSSDYVKTIYQDDFNEDSYNIDFDITEKWGNYYNANITINNISDSDIENWEITFNTPNKITNIWCAKITNHIQDCYTIKNVDWNKDINSHSSITFGITASYEEK